MFIALTPLRAMRSSGAQCAVDTHLHAAPDGAGIAKGPSAINMLLLRSKIFDINDDDFSCRNLTFRANATFRKATFKLKNFCGYCQPPPNAL